MHALATVAPAVTTVRPATAGVRPALHARAAAPVVAVTSPVPGTAVRGGPAVAQAGFLDDLLGTAVPGLLGAASSALSGDSAGALGAVRATGASAAPMLAQQGASALGGMIGGGAGQFVSSMGAPLGQGLGSVISGQATPGQAAGGMLSAMQPQLLSLLMSLLQR